MSVLLTVNIVSHNPAVLILFPLNLLICESSLAIGSVDWLTILLLTAALVINRRRR